MSGIIAWACTSTAGCGASPPGCARASSWTVAVGVVGVAAGIARLALLGWLLARVLQGAPPAALVPGLARGGRGHDRARLARVRPHHARPRDRGPRPGAAPGGPLRPGDGARARALRGRADGRGPPVDGRGRAAARGLLRPVPAAARRRRADPARDLRLHGVAGPAGRAHPAGGRGGHAARARRSGTAGTAPTAWPASRPTPPTAPSSSTRSRASARSRRSARAGTRLRLLEAKARVLFERTMGVLGTNTLARGITDAGIAVGAAVALGWGAQRVEAGVMPLATLARDPDARDRGVPPDPRAAGAAPPGHARALRRPGHPRDPRRRAAGAVAAAGRRRRARWRRPCGSRRSPSRTPAPAGRRTTGSASRWRRASASPSSGPAARASRAWPA